MTAGFWADRPTLVTGATGLVGGWVVEALLQRRADVVCLVRDRVPHSRLIAEGLSERVTVVRGDLRGILRARLLSRVTMRNIRQNLFFAFAYNALGVPVAAGVLYPIGRILLSPMVASGAMSLSSVSVIGNALRLRRVRLA